MARIQSVVGILKALALASWREVRSLGSVSGQNLFLFVIFVALQPESAVFFGLLFGAILLFPLLTDPLEKVPRDRRKMWPVDGWEWYAIRFGSLLLSPLAWAAALTFLRAGLVVGAELLAFGLLLFVVKYFLRRLPARATGRFRMPALPGATGALMRIQWREMLHTLDPYVALALMAATTLYRLSGKPLDPSAPKIISLIVALAVSTQTQVLFGIDGRGAERYRLFPLRGWQILLAKDLAFLAMLLLLVAPLDIVSGMFGGMAALAIGHHRSVLQPIKQTRWRFTSGALIPDGVIQTMALFAVGATVRDWGAPFMALCLVAWIGSLLFFGWRWDRVR